MKYCPSDKKTNSIKLVCMFRINCYSIFAHSIPICMYLSNICSNRDPCCINPTPMRKGVMKDVIFVGASVLALHLTRSHHWEWSDLKSDNLLNIVSKIAFSKLIKDWVLNMCILIVFPLFIWNHWSIHIILHDDVFWSCNFTLAIFMFTTLHYKPHCLYACSMKAKNKNGY